jgi:capsid protein
MLRWLTSAFTSRPAPPVLAQPSRPPLALLEEQVRRRLLETALFSFDNLVDPREPLYDSADFWLPLGDGEQLPPNLDNRKRGEQLPVFITEMQLKVIRDLSRKQCAYNEFAINALESRVSYTVGTGMTYKVVRKDDKDTPQDEAGQQDELTRRTQDFLDRFHQQSDWGELEQEAVKRADRDGEFFLRYFPQRGGIPAVRFVEPEHVKARDNQDAAHSFGVETDPRDVEDVKGYWVVECPDHDPDPTFVPAGEILHVKLNVDRNAKRGIPTLMPVRKNLERAEKLLRNMSTLAQVQATFALIRKHKGYGPSAVEAFRNAQADVSLTAPLTGNQTYFKQFLPGSVVDVPENVEYEFPAGSVDAAALTGILQAELRAVASRLCLAEYMLTSDASNANYSSTLVAESHVVKGFERLQDFYARKFGRGAYRPGPHMGAAWRAIVCGIRFGVLPREVVRELEVQVEGPGLVVRDKGRETERYKALSEAGLLSRTEWATLEGFDYHEQNRLILSEPKPPQQQMPGMGDPNDPNQQQPGEPDEEAPDPDSPFGQSPSPFSDGFSEDVRAFAESVQQLTNLPTSEPTTTVKHIARDGAGNIISITEETIPSENL